MVMEKETLEEAAESRFGTDMDSIRGGPVYDLNTDLKRGFVAGAKWQAERMYSEEDLRKSFHVGRLYQGREADTTFEGWFEQFKKK